MTKISSIKTQNHNDGVTVDSDRITLSFGEMEPIEIPRRTLRTRLQLVGWIYRLTGWPGMNLQRMRAFIATVFQHHGWALPDSGDAPLIGGAHLSPSNKINLPTDSIASPTPSLIAA